MMEQKNKSSNAPNVNNLSKELNISSESWLILREIAKICCARHLCAERNAYLTAAQSAKIGSRIFHLRSSEIQNIIQTPKKFEILADARQKKFESEIF